MRENAFYLVLGICGFMYGLLSHTYNNLEYKGYESAHSCTGDCYVKYVEENGTPAQIEQSKQELAKSDEKYNDLIRDVDALSGDIDPYSVV